MDASNFHDIKNVISVGIDFKSFCSFGRWFFWLSRILYAPISATPICSESVPLESRLEFHLPGGYSAMHASFRASAKPFKGPGTNWCRCPRAFDALLQRTPANVWLSGLMLWQRLFQLLRPCLDSGYIVSCHSIMKMYYRRQFNSYAFPKYGISAASMMF